VLWPMLHSATTSELPTRVVQANARERTPSTTPSCDAPPPWPCLPSSTRACRVSLRRDRATAW
jgi:hypothetical protein